MASIRTALPRLPPTSPCILEAWVQGWCSTAEQPAHGWQRGMRWTWAHVGPFCHPGMQQVCAKTGCMQALCRGEAAAGLPPFPLWSLEGRAVHDAEHVWAHGLGRLLQ